MSLITKGYGGHTTVVAVSEVDVDVETPDIIITISENGEETTGMISLKQGEAKRLKFTIRENGKPVPVAGATLSFVVKEYKYDETYILEKKHEAFDVSEGADGIVYLPLSAADTNVEPESYVAELKAEYSANDIIKSDDIDFVIEDSVFTQM